MAARMPGAKGGLTLLTKSQTDAPIPARPTSSISAPFMAGRTCSRIMTTGLLASGGRLSCRAATRCQSDITGYRIVQLILSPLALRVGGRGRMRHMARLKSEMTVECPCCNATLVVDTNLKRVVSHVEPERSDKRDPRRRAGHPAGRGRAARGALPGLGAERAHARRRPVAALRGSAPPGARGTRHAPQARFRLGLSRRTAEAGRRQRRRRSVRRVIRTPRESASTGRGRRRSACGRRARPGRRGTCPAGARCGRGRS